MLLIAGGGGMPELAGRGGGVRLLKIDMAVAVAGKEGGGGGRSLPRLCTSR